MGDSAEVGRDWPDEWLGETPGLYRPELWLAAPEIDVARFCQIYTWPLVLRASDGEQDDQELSSAVQATLQALRTSASWREERDLLHHLIESGPDDQAQSYAEFVFFTTMFNRCYSARRRRNEFRCTSLDTGRSDLLRSCSTARGCSLSR
jgi:hypothetical protein